MKVVISQPMFFPWVGLYEQVALSDVFVHYTDVQFSKGGFTNRVQIKTERGARWLTVPLRNLKLGQRISDVRISTERNWRAEHLQILDHAYAGCRYRDEMMSVVEGVYSHEFETIGELSVASLMAGCAYFGMVEGHRFADVSTLSVPGSGSQRVLDIVRLLGGTEYVTGHGGRNYLDHEAFERAGIRVSYVNYRKRHYDQMHGEFTPFVSILDLIANKGTQGREMICSDVTDWRAYVEIG